MASVLLSWSCASCSAGLVFSFLPGFVLFSPSSAKRGLCCRELSFEHFVLRCWSFTRNGAAAWFFFLVSRVVRAELVRSLERS